MFVLLTADVMLMLGALFGHRELPGRLKVLTNALPWVCGAVDFAWAYKPGGVMDRYKAKQKARKGSKQKQ